MLTPKDVLVIERTMFNDQNPEQEEWLSPGLPGTHLQHEYPVKHMSCDLQVSAGPGNDGEGF